MNEPFIVLYLIFNVIALALFGIDKHRAMIDKYRISEQRLLTAAFFGPFGAYTGMRLFRHKIRKPVFSIVVPVFILIHAVVYILFSSGQIPI
ncbi:MAG: DUF1294 domain-containing protein [Methanomicrobiales archaeon]|nr:DUF1294 domain-containing protein [Methanomicrobiales archaeon]